VLTGLEKFKSIILDFDKVPTVGQAFADEIFRVFQQRYRNIKITPINMIEPVKFMVDRVEKPKSNPPSDLAIIGRYILTPGIFSALERTTPGSGGEIQLTDALKVLAKSEAIYAYEFEGRRYDAGDKLGFIQANISFALKHPELKKELKRFLKNLKL
jgi:UTP-glucose-1-phosphate uridylyltransferase